MKITPEGCPICGNLELYKKLVDLGLLKTTNATEPVSEKTGFIVTKKCRDLLLQSLNIAKYRLMGSTACESEVFSGHLLALSRLPCPPSLTEGLEMAHLLTSLTRSRKCRGCRWWLTPRVSEEECSYIA
jgi:hypothetical protein